MKISKKLIGIGVASLGMVFSIGGAVALYTKAASNASRVLFIKDGIIFHQIYKGEATDQQMYQKISDTLTLLAQGGDK